MLSVVLVDFSYRVLVIALVDACVYSPTPCFIELSVDYSRVAALDEPRATVALLGH